MVWLLMRSRRWNPHDGMSVYNEAQRPPLSCEVAVRRCIREPGGGASPESAVTLILDVQLLDSEHTSPRVASPQPWYFVTGAEQPQQPCKGLTCTGGAATASTPQAHRAARGPRQAWHPSSQGACAVWSRRFPGTLLGSRAESFRNLLTVLLPPGPPCHGTQIQRWDIGVRAQ